MDELSRRVWRGRVCWFNTCSAFSRSELRTETSAGQGGGIETRHHTVIINGYGCRLSGLVWWLAICLDFPKTFTCGGYTIFAGVMSGLRGGGLGGWDRPWHGGSLKRVIFFKGI